MSVKVEEKSLALALVKAAGQLGVTQEEISYKVIAEKSGFLGLFGKKVSIEAWKKGTKSQSYNTHKSSSRQSPKLNLSKQEIEVLCEQLHKFCADLCEKICGEDVEVKSELQNDRLILNVENDYLAEQFQKNVKLAESFEHILRKVPTHIKQELPFRIFVDAGGRRLSREIELVDMAQDLSRKVFENKRPIVLNYRSSYDRKIIHMALDQNQKVYTKSIGVGPNRKLMILPHKEGSDVREMS